MGNPRNGARAISDLAFTNLLASAYSLQQWQDRRKATAPNSNFDELTGLVLDTQGLVWRHAVHPDTAVQLIARRSQKLCGAAGAAVAFLNGENLAYTVTTGIATGMLGFTILAEASSSFHQLRSQFVVESDTWADKVLGTKVMAANVLTVPIHRKSKLAGCFQLFSRLGPFGEQSKCTCQLMSAILGQLIEESEILQAGGQEHEAIGSTTASGESAFREPTSRGVPNPSKSDSKPGQVKDQQPYVKPVPNLRARPQAILYPALVVAFVVVANIYGRGGAWPLDLGTVIVLIFTVVELCKFRSPPTE